MATPYDLEMRKGTWESSFFDTYGNGRGEICLAQADGSVTPVDYKHTAPIDSYHYVHQLTGYIKANNILMRNGFGGGPALPVGMGLWLLAGDFERQLTDQKPIKKHMDFAAYTFHTKLLDNQTMVWKFQITDDGTPFRLQPGQSLAWRLSDNMSLQNLECLHVRLGSITVPAIYR